jgi:superfamily I DNA/RNA helicase
MTQLVTTFGSPGAGKTSFLVRLVKEFKESGVADDEIAYTTFQKSAALDAAERAGITGEDYRRLWFRTLHSICFRLLKTAYGTVVTPAKFRDFGKKIGIEVDSSLAVEGDEAADLAEVMLAIRKVKNSSDPGSDPSKLIGLYQLSRLLCRTPADLSLCRAAPHPSAMKFFQCFVNIPQYRGLTEHYENWKAEGGLLDFVDMLERVAAGEVAVPPWRVAFVDEAQDCAPLFWTVIERLFFDGPDVTFLAGDDDQAIMSFQGSTARDFLSYRDRSKKVHLRQTHRFGESIVGLGNRITQRITEREPKDIIPAPGKDNRIERIYGFDPKLCVGPTFLLHRHRAGCSALAQNLIERGLPFWNERGLNPLARSAEIKTYRAFSSLSAGKPIYGYEVALLAGSIPSFKKENGERVQLIRHGSKKKLEEMGSRQSVTQAEIFAHFSERLIRAVQRRDWSVTEVQLPGYYETLERNGWKWDAKPDPGIIITTIHGSKGREKDTVFLWDEVLPKCLRDENEHRVSYVGATRTKGSLFIVGSPATTWDTTHYPYPIC